MEPYDNEPTVDKKYSEQIIAARKAKFQDSTTRAQYQNKIAEYFRTWEIRQYQEVLSPLQSAIDSLVPMLGNFDPATEVYKQPPTSLDKLNLAVQDFLKQSKPAGTPVFIPNDPTKRTAWQKFQSIATEFYNVNDVVDDAGDVLIEEICDLCLKGVELSVKKALEKKL